MNNQNSNPESFFFVSGMLVAEKRTCQLGEKYGKIPKNVPIGGTLVTRHE